MYSLYVLCLYGISLNQVRNLVKKNISLDDFERQTEEIDNLSIHKPTLVRRITNIIPTITTEEKENNLYQLVHEGLSENIINSLIEIGLDYHNLNKLTLEQFNKLMGGQRKSVYSKVLVAFEKVEESKGRIPRKKLKDSIMEILTKQKVDETLEVEEIKGVLSVEYKDKIDVKLLQSIINELYTYGYIEYNSGNVKRHYPKLMDYLSGKINDKDIFLKRLQGHTLAVIAKEFQYSRQGVRNIEKRTIKRMPIYEEELRYKSIFENFDIPQNLFCKVFREPIEVYYFLGLKYKKGEKSIMKDIYNTRYTEQQRRIILRYYKCFLDKNDEIKEISKMSVFEEVLARYALNSVTDDDLIDKYNEYIVKNNLTVHISRETSLRGFSDRSQICIKGKSNTYRYYDFNVLTDVIDSLKDLLQLDTGVYSMKKIFRDNHELMEGIDIRSEYELHNLYRRMIEMDDVTYKRMPEFTVGNIDKKRFLIGLFKEYSPVSLDEFVDFVEELYGLRRDSLTSYILGNLNDYLDGDIIKTNYVEPSDEEYKQLENLLTKPIYTVDEVKRLGASIDDNFDEKFINNMTLKRLGYQIRNNFILNNNYDSVDEYFRKMILSEDYFINEYLPIYKTQTFGSVIYNLEKNFEIFKIEKNVYATFKKLSEAGITINDILDYRSKLLDFIGYDDTKYFTLYSIREEGFEHALDELGFSDIFYERLIWAFEEFRAIQTSSGYILKKTDTNLSIRQFLYAYVSEKRVVKLDDLIDYIEEVYNIHLETSKVIYSLRQTDAFYSEELYKFYIDKEDFFEEVYE